MADASHPAPRSRNGSDENLKSLGKLLKVLNCFTADERALTLAQVTQRTGFPRSTAFRLMTSLKEVGFLDQDAERDRYRLGLKLFQLGNLALANFDLHREAFPHVEELGRMAGNVVTLAVFDGYSAVVIRRTDVAAGNAVDPGYTENAPAYCTGVGKAILAYQDQDTIERLIEGGLERYTDNTLIEPQALRAELEQVRKQGYAIDEGEHRPGLRCIGAPIRDQTGRVFAGLSTSGPSWRLGKESIDELSALVMHYAERISRRLGYVEP